MTIKYRTRLIVHRNSPRTVFLFNVTKCIDKLTPQDYHLGEIMTIKEIKKYLKKHFSQYKLRAVRVVDVLVVGIEQKGTIFCSLILNQIDKTSVAVHITSSAGKQTLNVSTADDLNALAQTINREIDSIRLRNEMLQNKDSIAETLNKIDNKIKSAIIKYNLQIESNHRYYDCVLGEVVNPDNNKSVGYRIFFGNDDFCMMIDDNGEHTFNNATEFNEFITKILSIIGYEAQK